MLKVLYAGSPEASAKTLEILLKNQNENYKICGVLTNPPTAKGRSSKLLPTPVALLAKENGIAEENIFCPEHLDKAARETVAKCEPDILVCFAYGHIFGPKFLSLFEKGAMNLHPSSLPKYRGCTPVNAAILNRDKQTAISIQTVSLEMDQGDILAQKIIELDFTETATSLLNSCAIDGASMIVELLNVANKNGSLPQGAKQTGDASYTNIIKKEDARLDFNKDVLTLDAQIRAYNLEPGCFCYDKSGTNIIKILESVPYSFERLSELNANISESEKSAYTSEQNGKVVKYDKPTGIWVKVQDGILCVKTLQKQGKNVMGYKDFMNGAGDFVGSVLG